MDGDRNYIQLERLEFLVGGRQQNGEILWALTRDGRSVEAGNIAWDSGQGGPTHLKLGAPGRPSPRLGQLRRGPVEGVAAARRELRPQAESRHGRQHDVGGAVRGAVRGFSADGGGREAVGRVLPRAPLPFDSGWDKVDPDRDCKFTPDKGRLTIEAPAKAHDLSVEFGRMNAPPCCATWTAISSPRSRSAASSTPRRPRPRRRTPRSWRGPGADGRRPNLRPAGGRQRGRGRQDPALRQLGAAPGREKCVWHRSTLSGGSTDGPAAGAPGRPPAGFVQPGRRQLDQIKAVGREAAAQAETRRVPYHHLVRPVQGAVSRTSV